MTSIIRLHAISGAMGESPPCFLLQIDEFRLLLDCGWDEKFDMEFIKEIKKYVNNIDAVLLSHPDAYHLGALPYLVGKCGLSCPVYATGPVFKMGQMFMYDSYLSQNNTTDFDIFNLDDIDEAFGKIFQIEYNHTQSLKGKGQGISITAIPAGHMLGGTIWKIGKVGEEDIYYAIDHNNKKERHLNGCEWDKIQRPGVLITNAFNTLYTQEKRRLRDEMLLGALGRTLRSGGNALVAVDSAGRVLELTLMLDQMWRMKDAGLAPFSLVLLNHVAFSVMEFAKSQIEWMSEKLRSSFDGGKPNPFQLRNVVLCHSLIELSQVPSPKAVLTSTSDLESGFSRDLFMQWCQDQKSCVILTNRTGPGTLARLLIDDKTPHKSLDLDVKQKFKLEGRELEEYYRNKREEEKRLKNTEKQIKLDVGESESSDKEVEVTETFQGSRTSYDLIIRPGMETHVHAGIFKTTPNKYPVFPSVDNNKKKNASDEYGQVICTTDFPKNGESDISKIGKTNSSPSAPVESEVPSKCVCYKQPFAINCQVHFIDFEGRSDAESTLKMLSDMQPRKLIIVRGPVQAIVALEALALKLIPSIQVFSPQLSHTVDLTSNRQIYQVKLKDSLVSSLTFKKVRDSELAWVDGLLTVNDDKEEQEDPQRGVPAVGTNSLLSVPTLRPVPSTEVRPHDTIYVNKLKLTEFKQVLAKNGIEAQFSDGILQCTSANGAVAIQKIDDGRHLHIEVEGLSEEYYLIRSLLYDQLAIL